MNIHEIFTSIDGEVNNYGQGIISTFIRTYGCNLKCWYCDVAIQQKQQLQIEEIIKICEDVGCKKITITGGEPAIQPEELFELINKLLIRNFKISIESNGTIMIPDPHLTIKDICWVFDFKLNYYDMMQINMMQKLSNIHWVKFIINSNTEYQLAIKTKKTLQNNGCKAKFAFSSVFGGTMTPKNIMERLIEDKQFDIYINTQIHKIINIR